MEPPDLIDELERQIESPLELANPALEDPLSQMQSILETQIENTIQYRPATARVLPGMGSPEETEPIGGVRPPDPPAVEYSHMGAYQPPVYGTGIRSSHAGIRNPERVFCEHEQDYVDAALCADCSEWNVSEGECSYVLKRWEEQEVNDE
jgi:hypothetical protein